MLCWLTMSGPALAQSADTPPLSLSQLLERGLNRAEPERGEERVARSTTPVDADRVADAKPRVVRRAFRLSIVARDWHAGYMVAGEGLLLTDTFRLTRSSRMMLSRMHFGNGSLVPFAHVGFGEWRFDNEILPLMPRDQEFASQFSGGLELRVSRQARVAWEADYTVLCRERREPQNLPTPHVLGTFAVLETRF